MHTNSHNFESTFTLLQNYIKGAYSVETYSEMFSSLKENCERVNMAYCLLAEAKLLPENMKSHPKSSKESTNFREKGNKEFLLKQDLLAIQTYSVSAAFAPINSEELALAFANRSAVTFSLKEYESCVRDIDRALAGRYPKHLYHKLYERKGKCLKLLSKDKAAKGVFQLALDSLPISCLSEEKMNSVSASLDKLIQSCSEKDFFHDVEKKCPPSLSISRNDKILSASSLIQMEYTEELGRHLTATSDIEPGETLVVEQPFASVLLPSSYNTYCFHCKKRCHSLIPCLHCVVAMYCSEDCRSESWEENHNIECKLVPLLVALDFTKIEFIAVRTLLMATKQYKSIKTMFEQIPVIESNGIADPKVRGLDEQGRYNSADYRATHHLVGNLELRSNADVFRRAATAAYILHLLDTNTDYFSSVGDLDFVKGTLNHILNGDKSISPVKMFVGGLLFRYLMIVPSNAHEISEMVLRRGKVSAEVDCESVEIGGALYPVLSLINHSCDPNVVRHSHDGDLNVLTAIQVIPAGQQIFDNYGYHHAMHDVATRQSKLWAQYLFSCRCVACREDWPLYSQLPSTDPIYLNPRLKDEIDKSSDIFENVLIDIKSGKVEGKLPFLFAHLALLHRSVRRPWKEYSECQEAIKQCLSQRANHYFQY